MHNGNSTAVNSAEDNTKIYDFNIESWKKYGGGFTYTSENIFYFIGLNIGTTPSNQGVQQSVGAPDHKGVSQ